MEEVAGDASAPHAGRARCLHKWHPGGLHWEPAIMLAPGHREALSSWRLIPDFLLPGLEFKVNSCICKLIRLLKKTQEWKINGSVCFSPLLVLFHLPCSKVLLWPSGCGRRGWWQLARKAGRAWALVDPPAQVQAYYNHVILNTYWWTQILVWEYLFNYILFLPPWNNTMQSIM